VRRLALRVVVAGCIVLAVWAFAAPGIAAEFGWATAWPHNLPGSITFRGRDYATSSGCMPRSRSPLRGVRGARIGTLPVVFGPSLPILDRYPVYRRDPAPVILIVASGRSCYVIYDLQGGP
jgi:hypothetical protein